MVNEWQLIETRPNEVRSILVGSFPKGVMAVERFNEQPNNWTTMDGKYHKPTHWMELPDPPPSEPK